MIYKIQTCVAISITALTLPYTQASAQTCPSSLSSPWTLGNFNSLVTFGDSFTDETRLSYLLSHNGTLPPLGYFEQSPDYRPWARYVARYTEQIELYNYAVAGAVCSNEITPRCVYISLRVLILHVNHAHNRSDPAMQ